MKKNGFTLVELLAVIAILAILVIIALPNVLEMYRNARKNAFATEAKELYKQAQQKYMEDSLKSAGSAVNYAHAGTDTTKLDLQGGKNLRYCIKVDAEGNVTSFKASNGSYSVTKTSAVSNIEDLEVDATYAEVSETDPCA